MRGPSERAAGAKTAPGAETRQQGEEPAVLARLALLGAATVMLRRRRGPEAATGGLPCQQKRYRSQDGDWPAGAAARGRRDRPGSRLRRPGPELPQQAEGYAGAPPWAASIARSRALGKRV